VPPRSKVEQLSADLKKWLDSKLVASGFAGYELLEVEINKRLKAAGADFRIGKSSLHRYGSSFEDRLKTLRVVSEQAQAVIDASPDEEDAVNQALVRLTQEKLFNILMTVETEPEKINLPKLTKAIADLSRASISTKKYSAEVRARAAAAADDVATAVKKAGLSAEAADQIRRQILGIAG
jgi:uncharacterized protein YPO0396